VTAVRLGLSVCTSLGMLRCDGPATSTHEHQLFAFGTLVKLAFYAISERPPREAAQQVDAMYQRQQQDWHAWRRGHLRELNEAIAENRASQTDPYTVELIQRGQNPEPISAGC